MVKPRFHTLLYEERGCQRHNDVTVFYKYYLTKGASFFRGDSSVLTALLLTIPLYLQEETGSIPKWVTRFQILEFCLNTAT